MARYRSHSDTSLTMMKHDLEDQGISFTVAGHDILCSDPDAETLAEDYGLTKVKDKKHDHR